jgi:NHLM bacteriocin system ABC transporter ATP-binding protein
MANVLLPFGYTFYRPLPTRALSAWDLLKFGVESAGSRRELRSVGWLGVLLGLLSLLPPVATGWLFDSIIPNANRSGLLQVGFGLLLIAVAMGMLQVARGIAVLRLQSKMDVSIQAAVWDRLLSLPVSFFRDYASGDLGSRALGINTIRQILSGYVISAILTSLFATFNLALLFYYAPRLGLAALGLVGLSVLVTAVTALYYLRHQRNLSGIQGALSGTMLQLLTGIMKLRVAGAERQAFSLWADGFTQQKSIYYKARAITNKLTVFNSSFSLITSLTLFALTAYWLPQKLSTGDFLAFYLALLQFLGAWFVLSSSLVYILTIVPVYERLKPILEAEPEVDETKESPGELAGAIEVSHASFRYRARSPLVLQDVSLQVRPGEFVALVGASGSGKSTILRLLLGFEKPETGGIFYDDQDLNDLDVREVRKQIGVVMQNAIIQSGNVYKNIVGSSLDLTLDDAWEAARLAGFDKDIQDMPMGMHTVISARGGNLSGGQRQRLLIARALVHKPRILFFDEATSALDNRTQDVVNHNLEAINASRLVIAHRLTTIMQADRIYLFDNGRILQSGTYDELINQPGPFAELAKRQLAF